MWDFLVIWTLTFSAGDYGIVEKTFERRFDYQSQANGFIMHAPRQCKNIRLDSIFIDTSIKEHVVEDTSTTLMHKWIIKKDNIYLNGEKVY